MASGLTPEQRKVLSTILSVGAAVNASPMEIKSAVETGLVENNLTNRAGGDQDSSNWRQERASIYGNQWAQTGGALNLDASVKRYFQEAHQIKQSGQYGTAGALAAAVQRPRQDLRGKYQDVSGQADQLLGGASSGGGAAGGGSQTTTPGTTTVQTAPYEPDTTAMGTGLADLLAASMTKKQAAPAAAIADPSFSSAVRYGQGTIQPTGGTQQAGGGLDLATALQDLPSLQGPDSTVTPTPEVTTTPDLAGDTQKGGGTMKMSDGRVIVDPGANRPGKDLTPGIMKLVSTIAAEAGTTLHIGTGTNHNEMTTSGNVSDHWSGNGADIPSSGDALTKLGQEALVALGMDPKLAAQQKGGVFNLPYGKHRRIQILFNTNVGGNHFNHLHVGVTAKR